MQTFTQHTPLTNITAWIINSGDSTSPTHPPPETLSHAINSNTNDTKCICRCHLGVVRCRRKISWIGFVDNVYLCSKGVQRLRLGVDSHRIDSYCQTTFFWCWCDPIDPELGEFGGSTSQPVSICDGPHQEKQLTIPCFSRTYLKTFMCRFRVRAAVLQR